MDNKLLLFGIFLISISSLLYTIINMALHRRANTNMPKEIPSESQSEEISSQLDRLNLALEGVMKEIELSSVSRNPSRMSAFNSELYGDPVFYSESSDDEQIQEKYDSTIEKLLLTLDRQQMMLEDFYSEEKRKDSKVENSYRLCGNCVKQLGNIKKKISEEFSQIRMKESQRERKAFEERMAEINEVRTEYLERKHEVMVGIEKLKLKEKLLTDKENSLRMLRLSIDKQKNVWDKEKGIEIKPELINPVEKSFHGRAASYSYLTPPRTPEKSEKDLESKQDQLKRLQTELSEINSQGINLENAVHVESLKNQIARIRGELAMSESNRASRLISTMMASMQKEVQRDEKIKRNELLQAVNKNLTTSFKNSPIIPVKPTHLNLKTDFQKDNVNEAAAHELVSIKGKRNWRKIFIEKEKELIAREALLQQTWMRVPGAKELIENVNLTLTMISIEKSTFYKEREDFDKEKKQWLRSKKIKGK